MRENIFLFCPPIVEAAAAQQRQVKPWCLLNKKNINRVLYFTVPFSVRAQALLTL